MAESKGLDSYCEACCYPVRGLMFECRDCEFYLHVKCALLPIKLKQDGCTIDQIEHFEHPHPLISYNDKKKYEEKKCCGCGGGLSARPRFSYDDTSLLSEGSESIYGCLPCGFFLHECCARLPPGIDSPFHRGNYSLALISSVDHPICQGCGRPPVNCCYTYQCPGSLDTGNFIIGIECAFLRAPILELDTEHFLTLLPSVNPVLSCVVCNKPCDSSNIFRCVQYDYNLHLHCGPLPCSINDKCHIDPLKLMYDFVEDGYEDDIVYCDVCEKPRDPDQCVYYCKDCNFFAELKCVEAEVLCTLNGERGNVKLMTANKTRIQVGAKLINNVIRDNVETDSDNETEDIGAKYLEVEELHELSAYTEEESEQIVEIINKAVRSCPSTSIFKASNKTLCQHAHIERYELADIQSKRMQEFETSIFCYSSNEKSDLTQLMRNISEIYPEEHKLLEVFLRRECNIVRIGEHKIVSHSLIKKKKIVSHSAYVLKDLLHKYGDFTAKSKLSEKLKSYFLGIFCEVIRSMCLTNVRNVDEVLLRKWWKSLKLVQHAGFEIEFAFDHLNKIVQASFGMKALTSYREKISQVDKISNEIGEEEAELEAKNRELEAKKRELEAKKIHLEELKSHVDECKYEIEYQQSPVLNECLKQVSQLKWKKAWDMKFP